MTESYGEVDIFWATDSQKFKPKHVYFYVEGEYGFIPLLIGKGLEGDTQLVCEIMSKNMFVDFGNHIPNMMKPSWIVREVKKNIYTVSICHLANGIDSDMYWRGFYPIVRGVLDFLKFHGCETVTTISSMNHSIPQEAELFHYDFTLKIPPSETMTLGLPAWSIPYVWSSMGNSASVVVVAQDEGLFIDDNALKLMTDYFVALGFELHEEKMKDLKASLNDMRDALESPSSVSFFDDDTGGEFL